MKILILEDEDFKFNEINEYVNEIIPEAKVIRKENWLDYHFAVTESRFDLILLDLVVPRSSKEKIQEDHYESLVETTRDYRSKSFQTPAIVLTRYALDADAISSLNLVDINVIYYNSHGKWREALKMKLLSARPTKKFDFVIICALDKELQAYEGLTDTWGPLITISGLMCREIRIGAFDGVLVKMKRMGLVAAAIAASFSLERFEPRMICMSGICGGVVGESGIYDLLISQSCNQHDAGKWEADGFKAEHYDVQIDVPVHNKLIEVSAAFEKKINHAYLNPSKKEIPKGKKFVNFKMISEAVTSSGSAVIAEAGKISSLSVGHRKLTGFDMEVYSVYESARHAQKRTVFFAAKSVVDDGGENKGDNFHRIGCLISAEFVVEAIRSGIADVWC